MQLLIFILLQITTAPPEQINWDGLKIMIIMSTITTVLGATALFLYKLRQSRTRPAIEYIIEFGLAIILGMLAGWAAWIYGKDWRWCSLASGVICIIGPTRVQEGISKFGRWLLSRIPN